MKKPNFTFYPDLWLSNKALRACSPAARGFWVDVLALCCPEGYLTLNGQPIDDTQLSRLVGEPVKSVRAWLKELGEAGIYSVDGQRLYSSKMVRDAKFVRQAKESGARGQERKKARAEPRRPSEPDAAVVIVPPKPKGPPPAAVAKALPWWQTKAGWVRHGGTQALSMGANESFEDFQCRLAARLPTGPYLDALTPAQRKQVEAMTPKDPTPKETA